MAISLGLLALVGCAGIAQAGLTPEAKCEALKNKETGTYALCLQRAELKLLKTKGICSSTIDQTCYRDAECPSGETCGKDTTKYLLFLAKCEQNFAAHWAKWEQKAMDAGGSCPTTGDEAEIQSDTTADMSFLALKLSGIRFVDNGDGTVTDTQTGLMWEQKDNLNGVANPSDPHDADNTYAWSATGTSPDGSAFSTFLGTLNNGTSSDFVSISGCFAGHCDWRLPTIAELGTILDSTVAGCGSGNPCIDSVFGPTQPNSYLSSTTYTSNLTDAFVVDFNNHLFIGTLKTYNGNYVRAVRRGQ